MTAIAAVAALTVLTSFFCSLCEAALYAVSHAQVELHKQRGAIGADRLARLRANINQPIAAILTLNTIANTMGSALCGALVIREFQETYLGVFTAALTLTILFASEILPKTIGVKYAGTLAHRLAWPIQVMVWLAWPIVKTCGVLVHVLVGERKENVPTEDEIMTMSRLAARGGLLRPEELRWVENALRLDKIKALDIMTPRPVVYRLPADLPLADVKNHSTHWIHSRLPLTEDNDPDRIVGMVYRRDVFDALAHGDRHQTLRSLMHEIDFVPETTRGHQLLDKFIQERKHIVAVVDEYGSFEGVVTLEDVLECLIGSEIVDEHDRHADMQVLARQRAEKIRAEGEGRLEGGRMKAEGGRREEEG